MEEAGDLGEHAEAGGGLAAGAFEFVVEDGVFKAGEIEGGGVAHEADADVVGEAVTEEAFGEAGGAHEEVAGDGKGEFSGDEGPEVVRDARFCDESGGYAVDDEFGDPEHTQGHEGPQEAGGEGDGGEPGAGLPDHAEKRGKVPEGLEAISPGGFGIRIEPGRRPVRVHANIIARTETTTAGRSPPVDVLGESGLEATHARDSGM